VRNREIDLLGARAHLELIRLFEAGWLQNTVKKRLRQRSIYAEAEAARAFPIRGRLARVVELQRGEHELAEQAAADAPVRDEAQKRRRGAVDFDAQPRPVVTELGPALGEAQPMRCRDQERHRRAVVDVVTGER